MWLGVRRPKKGKKLSRFCSLAPQNLFSLSVRGVGACSAAPLSAAFHTVTSEDAMNHRMLGWTAFAIVALLASQAMADYYTYYRDVYGNGRWGWHSGRYPTRARAEQEARQACQVGTQVSAIGRFNNSGQLLNRWNFSCGGGAAPAPAPSPPPAPTPTPPRPPQCSRWYYQVRWQNRIYTQGPFRTEAAATNDARNVLRNYYGSRIVRLPYCGG
jgi:hypothetical protein